MLLTLFKTNIDDFLNDFHYPIVIVTEFVYSKKKYDKLDKFLIRVGVKLLHNM